MKKIQLTLLCIIIIFSSIAQDRVNAKFSSDSNPYESILKEEHTGKRTAKFLKNFIKPEVLRDYFQTSPCNEYATLSDTRITQFQTFITEFLSKEKDAKQMNTAEANFKKFNFKGLQSDIDKYRKYAEEQGTYVSDNNTPIENLLCRFKGGLQAIKSIQVYLEMIKKVFPSITEGDEALQLAKDILQTYPDNKSMLATIKKNLNAAIADVAMPTAVTKNADWEGWFKTYFLKNYPGYTYVKQALLSADWYVKKNDISGLPEYRQMATAIGAKAPDGKCKIIKLDIYQDYIGGKYSNSRFKEFNVQELMCENLK